MTVKDLIDNVIEMLDEDPLSSVFWTREEILQYVNDGFLELVLMTGKVQSQRPTFAPTTSTVQDTPNGAIAVLHVSRSEIFLRKKTVEALDREKPPWMNEVNAANVIKNWGNVGVNHFFVYPKLFSTGSVLTLVTLDQPTALVDGAGVVPLDEEYVVSLRDYAFHAARLKEGGAEFQQSIKAYEQFRSDCGHMMQRKLSEEYLLWSKEPHSDTGPRDSTLSRS